MGKKFQRWMLGVAAVAMCVACIAILWMASVVRHQEQVITLQKSMIDGKDELLQAQQVFINIKAQVDSTRTGHDSRFFRAYFVQDQLRWLRDYEKYIVKRRSRSQGTPVGIGGGN